MSMIQICVTVLGFVFHVSSFMSVFWVLSLYFKFCVTVSDFAFLF